MDPEEVGDGHDEDDPDDIEYETVGGHGLDLDHA